MVVVTAYTNEKPQVPEVGSNLSLKDVKAKIPNKSNPTRPKNVNLAIFLRFTVIDLIMFQRSSDLFTTSSNKIEQITGFQQANIVIINSKSY